MARWLGTGRSAKRCIEDGSNVGGVGDRELGGAPVDEVSRLCEGEVFAGARFGEGLAVAGDGVGDDEPAGGEEGGKVSNVAHIAHDAGGEGAKALSFVGRIGEVGGERIKSDDAGEARVERGGGQRDDSGGADADEDEVITGLGGEGVEVGADVDDPLTKEGASEPEGPFGGVVVRGAADPVVGGGEGTGGAEVEEGGVEMGGEGVGERVGLSGLSIVELQDDGGLARGTGLWLRGADGNLDAGFGGQEGAMGCGGAGVGEAGGGGGSDRDRGANLQEVGEGFSAGFDFELPG